MYNLILLYLNQIDNTYYKKSYKVDEFTRMNRIRPGNVETEFDSLVYRKIQIFHEKEYTVYNYRDIGDYKNFSVICNTNGWTCNEYKIPLKISENYWFYKFI